MSKQPKNLEELAGRAGQSGQSVKSSQDFEKTGLPKRISCPSPSCSVCRSLRPIAEMQEREKERREKYKGRQF